MALELRVRTHTRAAMPPCALLYIGERLIVGTYNLDETTGIRIGSLDVYTPGLSLVGSTPTPSAVLDLRECGGMIYSAHSTGEVRVWRLEGDTVQQVAEQVVDDSALVLQLAVDAKNVVATLSSGKVVLLDRTQLQPVWCAPSHSLEAWACAIDGPNGIYSGGDDMLLCYHDIREGQVLWKLRHHDAGITAIQPFHDNDTVWTGGYDDCLKIVDPAVRRVRDSTNLGGGVWRLIPQEQNPETVLACCMYGGLRILRRAARWTVPDIAGTLENNKSMVYGGAWIDNATGATCSFYDKLVQTWAI